MILYCFFSQAGIFLNPILSKQGDYPAVLREMVDRKSELEGRNCSRLPHFTAQEKQDLIGEFIMLDLCQTYCCIIFVKIN